MTPKRPYLFRAMYEWMLDNQLTPHIVVDTTLPEVQVPIAYVENHKITLNLAPQAVTGFALNNEALEFKASFGGRLLHLYIPMEAIIVIYALENNHCLIFGSQEINKGMIVNMLDGPEQDGTNGNQTPSPPKKPPKLSIVK